MLPIAVLRHRMSASLRPSMSEISWGRFRRHQNALPAPRGGLHGRQYQKHCSDRVGSKRWHGLLGRCYVPYGCGRRLQWSQSSGALDRLLTWWQQVVFPRVHGSMLPQYVQWSSIGNSSLRWVDMSSDPQGLVLVFFSLGRRMACFWVVASTPWVNDALHMFAIVMDGTGHRCLMSHVGVESNEHCLSGELVIIFETSDEVTGRKTSKIGVEWC